MLQKTKGSIKEIKQITSTVRSFILELKDEMNFKAGQFINISFKDEDEILRKPYSIASSPKNNKELELVINLVKEGEMTPALFKKEVGFEVDIMGPLGLFTMEEATSEKIVFIATGTGIGPMRSMLLDELSKGTSKEFILIFGNRFENEILYQKELEELETKHPNFRFIKVISRPSDAWEGRTGYVQQNIDMVDLVGSDFFICGVPDMVDETKKRLMDLGVQKEQIHLEKYI